MSWHWDNVLGQPPNDDPTTCVMCVRITGGVDDFFAVEGRFLSYSFPTVSGLFEGLVLERVGTPGACVRLPPTLILPP